MAVMPVVFDGRRIRNRNICLEPFVRLYVVPAVAGKLYCPFPSRVTVFPSNFTVWLAGEVLPPNISVTVPVWVGVMLIEVLSSILMHVP